MEEGKYEEAVVFFEKIPEKYSQYDNAQFAIDECKAAKEARAKQVIEDAKGMKTDIYKLKKKMMAQKGYRIIET